VLLRRLSLIVCIVCILAVPRAWAADPAVEHAQPAAETEHAAKDAHGGEHAHVPEVGHGNPGEQLTDPSEVRTDLAIYTFCVFVLLLAVLWKFAWGPIAAGLDRREKSIADNIAAAEEAAAEAKRLTSQYEAKLAGAADEIRQLLDEARRDAEHARQTIVEEARTEAGKERERTLREIESAKQGALKELGDRSADLAVSLAGRILQTRLNPADHAKLVRDAIQQFSDTGGSPN
jgi:F-type H+-transporting ATPase subunit b